MVVVWIRIIFSLSCYQFANVCVLQFKITFWNHFKFSIYVSLISIHESTGPRGCSCQLLSWKTSGASWGTNSWRHDFVCKMKTNLQLFLITWNLIYVYVSKLQHVNTFLNFEPYFAGRAEAVTHGAALQASHARRGFLSFLQNDSNSWPPLPLSSMCLPALWPVRQLFHKSEVTCLLAA